MEKIWSVLIKYKVRELRPYICLSQFFYLVRICSG